MKHMSMPSPHVATFLLLITSMALAGCPDRTDQAEIVADGPFENGVAPEDLAGTWLLIEQAGRAPETLWSVTFTTTGDYIVVSETRAIDHKHFHLSGENMIALADSRGGDVVELLTIRVEGDNLYLGVPGQDATTVLQRRDDLLEHRPDLVPPVTVDPEPGQTHPLQTPEAERDGEEVWDPPPPEEQ